MKTKLVIAIGCLSFLMSHYAFSGCGGGCQSCFYNENESPCQCTDPSCGKPDSNCMSSSECCEAFGNIGAR